jgi:hypothetical protein
MNVETVAANLRNTIAGKEGLAAAFWEKSDYAVFPENRIFQAMAEMLDINVGELKRILEDVEVCDLTGKTND